MIIARYQVRWIPLLAMRILALSVVAFFVFIGALVGYSASHREQAVTLPAPTGPFAVGRTIVDWTDPNRPDPLSQTPGTPRRLQVWIWYPADPSASSSVAPYLPTDWTRAIDADLGIGRFFRQDLAAVHSHARANPPLAGQVPRFPVVVFDPGYGYLPANYTTLLENLASHGYVVVGIVPTEMAPVVVFSDGSIVKRSEAGALPDDAPPTVLDPMIDRLVNVSSADVRFVLDRLPVADAQSSGQFASRLDLGRIAIVGHSLGGAAALEVCRTDPRCDAAVDIDGTPVGQSIQSGINRPFLMLQYGLEANSDEEQKARAVITHSSGPRFYLAVDGAAHLNGSDDAVLFEPILRVAGVLGSIDGRRGLDVTNAYLLAFVDQYLPGKSTSLLDGPSPRYPEVTFLSRQNGVGTAFARSIAHGVLYCAGEGRRHVAGHRGF
ncbi:MAG TPA: alpha/beta hydrolase [Chloroflexota bacterium]|nr:alpha/beta hydrolase [Chloroflexota bacterium]